MIKYTFRDDAPIAIKNADKADPQVIGEALAKIAAANDGQLTPEAGVEAARSPRHPLHRHLDWDNEEAAEKWRLEQMRAIIRIVRVVDTGVESGSSRAFLSIADKGGTAYRTLDEVRSSADLQQAVLRAAERDLEAFERRYRELGDICRIVRQAREAVQTKRTDASTAAPH